MENRKTASDLREHLLLFAPEYPIKNGYIARLLLVEHLKLTYVVRKLMLAVQTAEPEKLLNEKCILNRLIIFKKIFNSKRANLCRNWRQLMSLLDELFVVPFRTQPVSASAPPELASTSSSTLQPDTPVISTSNVPSQPSCSGSFHLSPSLKELKRDCVTCVTKRRTLMKMHKENSSLRKQVREKRKHLWEEWTDICMKKLNAVIEKETAWRAKYEASHTHLMYTQMLQKLLYTLEENVCGLVRDLLAEHEEIKNQNEQISDLSRRFKMSEERYKKLKLQYDSCIVQVTGEIQHTTVQYNQETMQVRGQCEDSNAGLENEVASLGERG